MTAGRRLFFACWPDPSTRAAMAAAGREAIPTGGRPVPAQALHVTLVFLGQVAEPALPAVLRAAEGLAAARFEIVFDRLEHWRKPRVLVALPTVIPGAATRLAQELAGRLEDAGFGLEARPWRPHVTLARKVAHADPGPGLAPVPWPVTGISLVESRSGRTGVRYEVRRQWPLAAPGSPPDPPGPADCSPG